MSSLSTIVDVHPVVGDALIKPRDARDDGQAVTTAMYSLTIVERRSQTGYNHCVMSDSIPGWT